VDLNPANLGWASVFVATGLVILAGGGEVLVRGAVNASRLLRVSPVVIGLTMVAFATSLPELAVSLLAAHRGSPDVAVGNVVGSNLFNIAVIIGISALLFPPLRFRAPKIRFDVGVMLAATAAIIICGWNGTFGRVEGIVLLALLAVFLCIRIRDARGTAGEALEPDARVVIEAHGNKSRGIIVSIVLVFAGAGLLTLGADILVRGAIFVARDQGISERVIALTLVSAGTGLPELVTAIVAGIRRHSSVAIGNVIGSNIFNVFGILGTVAIAYPPIKANSRIIHEDAFWMLGVSLFLLLPVLKRGRILSRLEGAILLAVYAGYLVWLIRTAGAGS